MVASGAVVRLALLMLSACTAYDAGLLPTDPGTGNGGRGGGVAPLGGQSGGGSGGTGGVASPSTVCGDGIVAGGEKCDTGLSEGTPGACPSSCPPLSNCLRRALNGTGCLAECVLLPESCTDGDDCCPGNCTADNDSDCSTNCGDGVIQTGEGETCEPDSTDSPCPESCDDEDPCTVDMLSGSPSNCNAECTFAEVLPTAGDSCCPDGANANTDADCEPMCGNMVREAGEDCDGGEGCDDQCMIMPTAEQQQCLDSFAADDCERCACLNCTQQVLGCRSSGDAARDAACLDIITCGRGADCVGAVCYCGTADIIQCITQPNGACIPEIQAAAGTSDSFMIETQRLDANTAVGRADILSRCSVEQCPDVCP